MAAETIDQRRKVTEVGTIELKIIVLRLHKEQMEKKMIGSLQYSSSIYKN